jgi:hypothetical protein
MTRPEAIIRALEGASDLSELLTLAQGAAQRVRAGAEGDAYGVAERLSRHLDYLRNVAELLRHELEGADVDPLATLPGSLPWAGPAQALEFHPTKQP